MSCKLRSVRINLSKNRRKTSGICNKNSIHISQKIKNGKRKSRKRRCTSFCAYIHIFYNKCIPIREQWKMSFDGYHVCNVSCSKLTFLNVCFIPKYLIKIFYILCSQISFSYICMYNCRKKRKNI